MSLLHREVIASARSNAARTSASVHGAGAWVMGFTAFVAFFIFLAALKMGEKNITRTDWFFLIASIAAMVPWLLSDDPLLSVILITIIDAFGFAPTFRKAYHKPQEETLITFALSAIKFVISIVALSNYSVVTVLYPLSLVIANGAFVLMLIIRRKQLGITKETHKEVVPT